MEISVVTGEGFSYPAIPTLPILYLMYYFIPTLTSVIMDEISLFI